MITLCPFCRQEYDIEIKSFGTNVTCDECKKKFRVRVYKECPECKRRITAASIFCKHCGTRHVNVE